MPAAFRAVPDSNRGPTIIGTEGRVKTCGLGVPFIAKPDQGLPGVIVSVGQVKTPPNDRADLAGMTKRCLSLALPGERARISIINGIGREDRGR